MELTPKQQTIDLLARAKRCLIVTHQQPDGDGIGSLLALKIVLERIGKQVVAACPTPVPQVFQFLPEIKSVVAILPNQRDVIISVKTDQFQIEKLGYRHNSERQTLDIVITPKTGTLTEQDIKLEQSLPEFDAVITLDTPDIDRLGSLYDEHTKLFYGTPVINIDHHPSNEQFGTINWVDMVATSTAEIMVALIESLAAKLASQGTTTSTPLLDESVATCLLTGIITDTGSFQNINTTPKSLTVAAQLVATGARQQDIIYHLYKTKSLSTLKLWGSVLARVTDEPTYKFIWTRALPEDFSAANAQETELAGLIDELLKTTRDRDFVIVFSVRGAQLHGSIRGINHQVDASALAQLFGGGGHHQAAAFDTPIKETLEQAIKQTLEQVKSHLSGKLVHRA